MFHYPLSFSFILYYLFVTHQCIWRMLRMMPDIHTSMDLGKVLLETHHFLVAFPNETWKNKSTENALRTIKTVIHTLAKLRGKKVSAWL